MTSRKIRIGILETGRPPETLAAEVGDYPGMVARWLAPLDAEFASYPVLDGVLPQSVELADLWVITGSRYAVYETHGWLAPLRDFIRASRLAGSKMIGICFGHEIIAQALGGEVEKSARGWELGVHHYAPLDWPARLGQVPAEIVIQAYHRDQVTTLAPGSRQVARSESCENAVLWYPGFAMTFQGHPEFSKAYVGALFNLRRGTLGAEAVDRARGTFDQATSQRFLANMIRDHMNDI